ncbi:hypothetical protein BS78_05G113900 [Paspalum vaginatum]|nr:hypothetical protein BS78_05G113900 [Paspalum vaginatum]KAJ1275145.1 hypothetical protein BS78_05G113900 [Paspalum vaginatum]KAJ1275147.1 hypothetical protein BS78_05G113900 [Paspalum vaginatum]
MPLLAAAVVVRKGTEEWETTSTSVSTLNGTMKCKKKVKKKNKMREKQESPPDLDSMVVPEAGKQGAMSPLAVAGVDMWTEERESTAASVSALNGTLKCKKKKIKNRSKMQEELELPPGLDSMAAPDAEKQGEAKGMWVEKPEATNATASEGTLKCNKKEAKVKRTLMPEEETTAIVVSAPEVTPKHKRKRKKKMQKELESPHASLGAISIDKINAKKSENGFADGAVALGHADVSMVPISGEDLNCAQSKANVADVLVENKDGRKGNDNLSENGGLLQESSVGRKIQRKKRKWGSSSGGPGFSSENAGMVAKDDLDSSTHHDLSCICASCLVGVHEEKMQNMYSPRGSLVRFQRKKLLILDLNGLLADINQDYHNAHKAHAKVRSKLVFRRPCCDDFLRFCFQNFELGIWSSRKRENVNSVCNILMRDLKQHLLFCWDMSYCTVTGCNTVDNKHKPLVLKELKKLWNKEEPSLPWELGEFSPSNTLLVDDSPYKALCNPPNTAIFPQPYSYLNERDDYSLGPGGDLRVYLERVAAADNVQYFVRDNPFGQNSITESDPNWNFYKKIFDKVEKQIAVKVERSA